MCPYVPAPLAIHGKRGSARERLRAPVLRFGDVFELDTLATAQAGTCLCSPLQKTRIVFKLVIEPIVFGGEAREDPRWSTVPRNDDLFFLRHAEVFGQIILEFSQRHFFHHLHRIFSPSR